MEDEIQTCRVRGGPFDGQRIEVSPRTIVAWLDGVPYIACRAAGGALAAWYPGGGPGTFPPGWAPLNIQAINEPDLLAEIRAGIEYAESRPWRTTDELRLAQAEHDGP